MGASQSTSDGSRSNKRKISTTPEVFLQNLADSQNTDFMPYQTVVMTKEDRVAVIFGENHDEESPEDRKDVIDTLYDAIDLEGGETMVVVESHPRACDEFRHKFFVEGDKSGINKVRTYVCGIENPQRDTYITGVDERFHIVDVETHDSDKYVVHLFRMSIATNSLLTWMTHGEEQKKRWAKHYLRSGVDEQDDITHLVLQNASFASVNVPSWESAVERVERENISKQFHGEAAKTLLELKENVQEGENLSDSDRLVRKAMSEEMWARYRHFEDTLRYVMEYVSETYTPKMNGGFSAIASELQDALGSIVDIYDELADGKDVTKMRSLHGRSDDGAGSEKLQRLSVDAKASRLILDSELPLSVGYFGALHTGNIAQDLANNGWSLTKFLVRSKGSAKVDDKTLDPGEMRVDALIK